MINLEIDGKPVQVENGATVMEAANKVGSFVPHFCYHRKLSIAANCRMCLVQVEKAPKPLPACATPATEGMKVQTESAYAKAAQKGVMEFLLINHPLDCPICDQGGECQLQDLAVGYGPSASRYQEEKRVVVNKNLGPLIATDMTRCIHCTRCVRFGQEIAGIMELGMAGRGEHSEILSFVGRTVDSELSGNMIDLCPVGALTSKPFRYQARSWELSRRKSISPHDSLGSNLVVQVKNDRVMRVLPNENEAVNECWISDRDRFAYEGLNTEDRLTRPMIKQDGAWQAVSWQEALEYVANGLSDIRSQHGGAAIGALGAPNQTLEELHLLQKFVRGLGSENVDTRLRQADTSADGRQSGAAWLGMPVADISALQSVLVIGSTLRKDHPLLLHRLRQGGKRGQQLNVVHVADDDLQMVHWAPRVNALAVAPSGLVAALAQVARAVADAKSGALAAAIAKLAGDDKPGAAANAIAASLAGKEKTAVFLGNTAQHHPSYVTLHLIAQEIARLTGATLGILGEAANSVGAAVVNAQPGAQGLCAQGMAAQPRTAMLLLGVEPEFDCYDPQRTLGALQDAAMVVAMSPYASAAGYADVMLPIAPFTETAGTFVNAEGRVQSFNGVVKPLGEARPAWKVLRVLGTMLGLHGFDLDSIEDVRKDILAAHAPDADAIQDSGVATGLGALVAGKLNNTLSLPDSARSGDPERDDAAKSTVQGPSIERISETGIYSGDSIVRRAASLQKTRDGRAALWVSVNPALFESLKLSEGQELRVMQGAGNAVLKARSDASVPANCVRTVAGHPATAALGPMFGPVTLDVLESAQAAE